MKIAGIIAEYNPFHQGHAYQLYRAKVLTDADACVVVMSGNYVQRGTPAMFDKYTRAEAALRSGADVVLELPLSVATGSAEFFAKGAVDLLTKAGVTDLCFGSECGNLSLLEQAADILAEEPEEYRALLGRYLKEGYAFPKARMLAMQSIFPSLPDDIMQNPNNLLGVEYLKSIRRSDSSMKAHTVKREGTGYHETDLSTGTTFASASGIRNALIQNKGIMDETLKKQLPAPCVYEDYQGKTPITEDAFSLLLLARLRFLQDQPLDQFFDVTPDLSNRIWNLIDQFQSFSQFADLLKTKNLTRTAINRALLHILLDVKQFQTADAFRVLGFRRDSAPVLRQLKNTDLPVITSLTDAALSGEQLYADRLYESVRSLLHGIPYQNEYRRKALVIEKETTEGGLLFCSN